jgi:hypothetical protein
MSAAVGKRCRVRKEDIIRIRTSASVGTLIDDAVNFYLRSGFVHCPLGELFTVENLRALFNPDPP